MSQRTYIKDTLKIIIESIGSSTGADDDIWYATVVLPGAIEVRALKTTVEVKELVTLLEKNGWIKEALGEKPAEAR
jgi:hypothetical protein